MFTERAGDTERTSKRDTPESADELMRKDTRTKYLQN